MIAYKLFRLKKDGNITSLFINKKRNLPFNVWLDAECFPTKGYAERPFWHCTEGPIAPHLSPKGRVWAKVEIENFRAYWRPSCQGGLWFLSKRIKILKLL